MWISGDVMAVFCSIMPTLNFFKKRNISSALSSTIENCSQVCQGTFISRPYHFLILVLNPCLEVI